MNKKITELTQAIEVNDNDILSIKNISITNGFKGMNIKRTITITNNEMALLNKLFIPDSPF